MPFFMSEPRILAKIAANKLLTQRVKQHNENPHK